MVTEKEGDGKHTFNRTIQAEQEVSAPMTRPVHPSFSTPDQGQMCRENECTGDGAFRLRVEATMLGSERQRLRQRQTKEEKRKMKSKKKPRKHRTGYDSEGQEECEEENERKKRTTKHAYSD